MAANTKKLLDHLGIKEVAVVGHSMGGMLATRFALMYPGDGNPLDPGRPHRPGGLPGFRAVCLHWRILYANELKANEESIRNYHKMYYVHWKPAYDEYVKLAGAASA